MKDPARIEWVIPFDDIALVDGDRVGGKNASLGEMVRELTPLGIRVPGGFATTAEAYRAFLEHNELADRIAERLGSLDPEDVSDLRRTGGAVRELIMEGEMPPPLVDAIRAAYTSLGAEGAGSGGVAVAVRSSATAEDLPEASFAGQQETFLNVRGTTSVVEAVQRCFASLFTDRAIAYRANHGFDHMKVALSAGVQRMVRADIGAAGVMFTLDTESGFRDVVLINASYGLGENVVRGVVSPDEFFVHKPTLERGFRPIVARRLGKKSVKTIYDRRGGSHATRNVPVPASDRDRFSISDDEVLQLARWGIEIERHYGMQAGADRPMDIEWARDGVDGKLYILQARPETVHAQGSRTDREIHRVVDSPGDPLVRGLAIGRGIGQGPVQEILSADERESFEEGGVLVTEMTDPDWVPIMRRAAAIVTERGGRTCHAAIVSRELGVPAIVGADHALERLRDGMDVTVSCAEGDEGAVYEGLLEIEVQRESMDDVLRPRTSIMMNIADPSSAFERSALPVDGVGLARLEFIIGNQIGIHPMAALDPDGIRDPAVRQKIDARTGPNETASDFFERRLAEGVGRIAAAFYPRPVIVRLSDFKSNEYADLLGGSDIEPDEENPMLGLRGASRYLDDRFRPAFELECSALRQVRAEMGLDNVKLMVPFCRTLDEADRVLRAMAEHGLARGEDGLEVYVMCEIPSNAMLAEAFGERFDGLSIGSNDLTQLVLGVDRDSATLAPTFDESDPAVRGMVKLAIQGAHRAGRPIGICGQAPSDDPEFAAFLVREGIDSISLSADAVLATMERVAKEEARLHLGGGAEGDAASADAQAVGDRAPDRAEGAGAVQGDRRSASAEHGG